MGNSGIPNGQTYGKTAILSESLGVFKVSTSHIGEHERRSRYHGYLILDYKDLPMNLRFVKLSHHWRLLAVVDTFAR